MNKRAEINGAGMVMGIVGGLSAMLMSSRMGNGIVISLLSGVATFFVCAFMVTSMTN